MIGIAKTLATAPSPAAYALRPCPFCGSQDIRMHEDPVQHHIKPVPMSAMAYCGACGAQGPSYWFPLACLKAEPWPDWDPRDRAAAAWDAAVETEGLEGPPRWTP